MLSISCAVSCLHGTLSESGFTLPMIVSAAVSGDGFAYSVSGDSCTITGYSGTDTVIEIPESVDGYAVTQIGSYAFENNYQITEVTVPESITAIGEYAFSECSALEKITILNKNCVITEPDNSYSDWGSSNSYCNVTICNRIENENTSGYEGESWCDYGVYNGIICGYRGSTAESYENNYSYYSNCRFIALQSGDNLFDYTKDWNNEITIEGYFGTETNVVFPAEIDDLPVTAVNISNDSVIVSASFASAVPSASDMPPMPAYSVALS